MFQDNLISLRKLHGFSQDELAEKIGVTRQTLSKNETGESLPEIKGRSLSPQMHGRYLTYNRGIIC